MQKLIHRQGDVALVRVDGLPDGAVKKERDAGRVVLAYGEVTGHAHTIEAPGAALWDVLGKTYLTADALLDLCHQEHATQHIEPGVYQVVIQREYSPEAIRNVLD